MQTNVVIKKFAVDSPVQTFLEATDALVAGGTWQQRITQTVEVRILLSGERKVGFLHTVEKTVYP